MRTSTGILLGVLLTGLGAVGGYLARGEGPTSASVPDAQRDMDLEAEVARLRTLLSARAPSLEGREAPAPASVARAPGEASGTSPDRALAPLETLDLASVTDAQDALRRLMRFLQTQWARGEAGHLVILRALDRIWDQEDLLRALAPNEEEALRNLYPLIRFLVRHDRQVAATAETLFRTLARRPEALQGIHRETLLLFTDGAGVFLPGILPPEKMDRLREHAGTILETPASEQSPALRSSRDELEQLVHQWTPPLSPEAAAQKLQSGTITPREAVALLHRLTPAEVASHDLHEAVQDALRLGIRYAVNLVSSDLDGRTLEAYDEAFFDAIREGELSPWVTGTWLQNSGRRTWAQQQAFFDVGIHSDAGLRRRLIQSLGTVPLPPEAWLQGVRKIPDLIEEEWAHLDQLLARHR